MSSTGLATGVVRILELDDSSVRLELSVYWTWTTRCLILLASAVTLDTPLPYRSIPTSDYQFVFDAVQGTTFGKYLAPRTALVLLNRSKRSGQNGF
jgi:hypothetical protein